jgi:hypothetical protein
MLARSKGHFYSKHLVFFRPPLQFLSWYLVATNVFVFNFVMLFKWRLSKSIFSQIWQYSKYESRKILSTLSYCKQLWQFLVVYKESFFCNLKKKKGNLWRNILFSKLFWQNGENNSSPTKSLMDTRRVSEKRPNTLYWCFR